MRLIMDAGALIKLTRCGAKEAVTAAFEVVVPQAVAEEATAGGFTDGALIAVNLAAGHIRTAPPAPEPPETAALPEGGERKVYALFRDQPAREARLVSDDRRFIRRLAMVGVTAQTPGVVLVALVALGGADRTRALSWLQEMRPLISAAEYEACRQALEEVR